jgi:uncharacterized membrane protein YgcG
MRYLLLIFFLLSLFLKAEHIENYHVEIKLQPSGVFHVAEEILYDFSHARKEKHGIYRFIPTHVEVNGTYVDTGMKDFTAMQDGKPAMLSVRYPYHYVYLKIGDPALSVHGRHLYRIDYDVTDAILPSVFSVGKDMLFWNAVGDKWEVPIHHAVVDLILPKTLSKPHILYPESKERYRWVDSHHLQVSLFNLDAYEGLAVALEFDRGSLAKHGDAQYAKAAMEKARKKEKERVLLKHQAEAEKQDLQTRKQYGYGMWVFFLVLGLFWYRMKERLGYITPERSRVVRYYPPEGLSVLQSALLYDKFADNRDISAAILELASLKHLVIVEDDGNTFLLKRERPEEGLQPEQKMLLEALFANGERYALKQHNRTDALTMQKNIAKINSFLYQWASKSGYTANHFAQYRRKVLWILLGTTALLGIGAFILLPLQYETGADAQKIAVLTLLAFIPALAGAFTRIRLRSKLLIAAAGTGTAALLIASGILNTGPRLEGMDLFINPLFFVMVAVIVAVDTYRHTGRVTPKGEAVREHLRGLEVFSARVKRDEIERLLLEDRHYLETMLPYAMLFGQIEHWLRFYDQLDIPRPGMSNGSTRVLYGLADSVSASTSVPSGRSSGGYGGGGSYGGGGFSGGGGGGGGGSW